MAASTEKRRKGLGGEPQPGPPQRHRTARLTKQCVAYLLRATAPNSKGWAETAPRAANHRALSRRLGGGRRLHATSPGLAEVGPDLAEVGPSPAAFGPSS
eukprot:CAMPEP_0176285462 /NCGR_PEP_ID=MMETSP0121_2-20121125/52383_1 /TAXON_ID=160619 /ORGANISM="Kryptoperidinium foliaceum, Strain CCMP 1326" /LENGTH=99 /DNA_ID=CAMNT_0017625949 /DNA_START=99 /DNA_END=394 /DNA_ORIENTATION=-